MNKQRRAEIAKIIAELEDLKSRIEELKDQEDDAFNNLPESMQDGEKGEKAQSAIDALDEAFSEIETAIENLQTAAE